MQRKLNLKWLFGGLGAALFLIFTVIDAPRGFFSSAPVKPVPGKVYQLTEDNLTIARRQSPVLVALYTKTGNAAGARMSRSLNSLAGRMKGSAIVAIANVDEQPALTKKAALADLPAWVVYRDGVEISRATGENADLSINRLIAEATGTEVPK